MSVSDPSRPPFPIKRFRPTRWPIEGPWFKCNRAVGFINRPRIRTKRASRS